MKANGKQKEISYEEAIKNAVEMLRSSKSPFFYGWASATSETQQKGIELAQKVNGRIDCATTCTVGTGIQPLFENNIELPKLSYIKDSADVLVFLGSNPTASHIRLLSKYALLARGANTDRGIEDRTVITIDIRKTDMSKFSEEFLQITPGKGRDLIEAITQIIEERGISAETVANISRKDLYEVANIMKDARYGVIFFGGGYLKTEENMIVLIKLINALKQKGVNFGAIPLDGGYNALGFCKNLKDQACTELNADFKNKNHAPEGNLLLKTLKTGDIDLLVVLGSDPISNYPFHLSKQLAKVPLISIDFQQTPTTKLSKIVLPTTIPGVESAGTAYRLDLEPITLKSFMAPPAGVHSDEKILQDLLERV